MFTAIVIFIEIIFFFLPFFWLKPGFVNLGGDAGRLYFLDPFLSFLTLSKEQTTQGALLYSMIPYEMFLSVVKFIIHSPTWMIAFDYGCQLAFGFLGMYLLTKEILQSVYNHVSEKKISIYGISILSGIVYIGFVTKLGWATAMQTQNQVFLNPLLCYLLLRFFLSSYFKYLMMFLCITILYSGNFGYTSAPQLLSFYPLALLFLVMLFLFVYKKPFPWKKLWLLGVAFVGLHAFHIVPSVASVVDTGSTANTMIFGNGGIHPGVQYFDANHIALGKISLELFQPSQWHGQTVFVFLIPLIILLGFFKKPSRLLALVGIFFAITFFLVSANITNIGTQFYRSLFFIPGFSMFRSFDEKWYFVYAFFYALLFAVSFFELFSKKYRYFFIAVGVCIFLSIGYRITPFIKGKAIHTMHYQSNSVSTIFRLDPDLLETIQKVRTLPDDGNIWTLPLTFPYFQVAYGKEGGAYVGISIVENLAGRKDFPGFWTFGSYQESLFEILRKKDTHALTQLLSLRNIRYIFQNTDERIMENFPGYPYVYPGELYYTKDVIPTIKHQSPYIDLLHQLPISSFFEQGVYTLYAFDEKVVRPTIYIPDVVYASQSGVLAGDSYRSAYGDMTACEMLVSFGMSCDGVAQKNIPPLSFTKRSETAYDITIDGGDRKEPFLVVLSEDYHNSWNLKIGERSEGITHIRINEYANAWVIDPNRVGNGVLHGSIMLEFQKYYTYGWMISGITFGILIIAGSYMIIRRKHGKK